MNVTRHRVLAQGTALIGIAASFGAASRAARAQGVPAMQIGTITIDPCMQPLYAQELGLFKAAGLDPQITIMNNSAAEVAALAAGSIDVASASVPTVAYAHQHGIPIRFIAAASIYTGPVGNTNLMVAKTSPVKSGADISGKTVAVSALHDMTQFETSAWVDKTGGDSKSVRFVELKYTEMATALEQGRADAAVLIEPYVTSAKATSRILANLSDTMGGPYVVSGWVSSEDYIRKNPEAIRRFVAVMQKSAAWANTHQKESGDILVRYAKIRPEIAAAMNRIHYYEGFVVEPSAFQRQLDMMAKYGALPQISAKDIMATV